MNSSEQNFSEMFFRGVLGAMFGVATGTLILILVYILLNGKSEIDSIIKMDIVSLILAFIGLLLFGGIPSGIAGFIICFFQTKIYFNLVIGFIS